LRWVTISVQDMDKSLDFLEKELSMTRTADLRLHLPKSNSLLLPRTAVPTRIALLSMPGATLAGIRLVQVAPCPLEGGSQQCPAQRLWIL